MKMKKLILVAVMQVVIAFILSTHVLAVSIISTTSDGLTTGVWNGPMSATTTQAATVKANLCCEAIGGGECFNALIDDAFLFSYTSTIELPEVGMTFDGGFINQAFHDGGAIHEGWHQSYIEALLNSTYGALETWSSTYVSNKFNSAAAALAAGNTDLANALTVAENAFMADFSTDVNNAAFGHQNAVAEIQEIGGVDTWVGINDDWGQPAVDFANTIKVAFTKTPGNCTCVPEPSTGVLFAFGIGVIGFAVARRRRRRQQPVKE